MRLALCGLAILALAAGCRSAKQEYTVADLTKILKEHQDPDMRGWAARELGRVPAKDAPAVVKPLTDALGDSNATVRMEAAYGLADLGPEASAAVPALTKLKQDQSTQVRWAADHALKEIQRKK
jgi:HEAT repeat protein